MSEICDNYNRRETANFNPRDLATAWKKFLLLPTILLTPVKEKRKRQIKDKCEKLYVNYWDEFRISGPKPKTPRAQLINNLMLAGAASRVTEERRRGDTLGTPLLSGF